MLARVSVLLGKINPALGELWGIQLCIFFLVVALTLVFLFGYLLQGTRVAVQLWDAARRIRALVRGSKSVEPRAIAAVFTRAPFNHLWQEYSHTLHVMERRAAAAGPFAEVRATVPAELFFTREALVDGRLFEDFTRHLPGVLTGLGIIGTFAGLLEGLGGFDATSSVTAVAGLKHLLDGVAHAFTTSAIAIGCAMLVIFISKFALAIFYQQVESLNQLIDAIYTTGAGEEYLSRLVHASEQSGPHAAAVNQDLLAELARLLNTLSERQIEAGAQNMQALGRELIAALQGSAAPDARAVVADALPRAHTRPVEHDAPRRAADEFAPTLADLEAPITELREATAHIAAAVQEIHAVLARLPRG